MSIDHAHIPAALTVVPDALDATVDASPRVTLPPEVQTYHRGGVHLTFPHLFHTVRSLLMTIVVALFALTFLLQPFQIPSESMERTLLVGDFLLVNKSLLAPPGAWGWLLPYRQPRRGDVVVFHFPLDPQDHVVKRVIGASGDRVHLHNGEVYLDGQPQREPYAVYESAFPDAYRDQFPSRMYTDPGVDTHWWLEMRHGVVNGDVVVPPAEYFVMGDNRNHSRDSRYWGFVPQQNIVGMPFLVYFSVREPSATDNTPLPDDRLGRSMGNRLVDFARWDRVLHVVH